jgi:CTP:molybdopterin cytidylyltransferase MocA
MSAKTSGLILAAGAGRRFGGGKLLAQLDGRPLLQHVLDLAAALSLRPTIVVLGSDADALEAACRWREEQRIRNENAQQGISSSLRLGLEHLADSEAERALVLLADQPMLTAGQARAVLDVAGDELRPIVVPRYRGTPGNPVLLERGAWRLAADIRGDRGMSQLIERRPDLVRYVEVPGTNPDIDTPDELGRISRGGG